MPGMNGAELCRAVRTMGGQDVYVILLTARGADCRFDGLHAGADDYLDKPLDVNDLLASVLAGQRVLADAEAPRESARKTV
jgi:DNA-binding response OmpR family regulator